MIDLGDYYVISLSSICTFSSILVLCYYCNRRESNIDLHSNSLHNNSLQHNYISMTV